MRSGFDKTMRKFVTDLFVYRVFIHGAIGVLDGGFRITDYEYNWNDRVPNTKRFDRGEMLSKGLSSIFEALCSERD